MLQPTVKGPVHFGGKVVPDPTGPAPVEQPAAAAPAADGWKFEPTQMFKGRPVGVKDGKWVYEDGSLVEGQ